MNEAQLSLDVSKDVFSNIPSNGLDVKKCILNGQGIIASILDKDEIEICANLVTFLVSSIPAKTLVRASQELAKLGKPFNKETCPRAFEGAFRVYVTIPTDSDADSLLCHGKVFLVTSKNAVECSFVLEYRLVEVAPGIIGWMHINYTPKISGVVS